MTEIVFGYFQNSIILSTINIEVDRYLLQFQFLINLMNI